MSARLWQRLTTLARAAIQTPHHHCVAATKPDAGPIAIGSLADAGRSKPALIAENALPRQQLLILQRSVKRPPRRTGQTRATVLRNHGPDMWARDFLPVTDLLFRPLYAFVVIALASRRIVHVCITRHSTDTWAAQLLREATAGGRRPQHLIHDNDSTHGPAFTRVAVVGGIAERRAAHHAVLENAICERCLGTVRRECLGHLLVLDEAHLRRILRAYQVYFNRERPHTKDWGSGCLSRPKRKHAAWGPFVPSRSWAGRATLTTERRNTGRIHFSATTRLRDPDGLRGPVPPPGVICPGSTPRHLNHPWFGPARGACKRVGQGVGPAQPGNRVATPYAVRDERRLGAVWAAQGYRQSGGSASIHAMTSRHVGGDWRRNLLHHTQS